MVKRTEFLQYCLFANSCNQFYNVLAFIFMKTAHNEKKPRVCKDFIFRLIAVLLCVFFPRENGEYIGL